MPFSDNLTPVGSTPEKPTGAPAKYQPVRTSPGATGQTAPIAGQEQQAPRQTDAPAGDQQEGGEEEGGDTGWRLSVVAQKEAKARQRIQEAKAGEARLKAMEDRITAREAELKKAEERQSEWRRNPAALLRDHGYVPETALQFMLNGERLTPDQQLAANLQQRLDESREQFEQRLQTQRGEDEQRREKDRQEQERRDQEVLQQQEEAAYDELRADISEVVTDEKAFPLVTMAGDRGVQAIVDRLNALSDQIYKESGRRPPLTTRMLERAAKEIEDAARAELEQANERVGIRTVPGVRPPPPRAPQTLTNRAPVPGPGPVAEGETEAQKRERVKAMIEPMLRGGRAR